MPTFYNYTEGGQVRSIDDVFVPADAFRQGTLFNWGNNDTGGLGINDVAQRNTPVTTLAGGANWKQLACGSSHTVAIKTDGTLWTWGYNYTGQLGINLAGTENRTTPVTTFAGGTNWKQVSCGDRTTAAIKTDGTLWTWGSNEQAQLGINVAGTLNMRCTPVTTFAGGTNWKQVSCFYHTAAIKTDGTLWIWGKNSYGHLGINDTNRRCTPVTTFAGGTNWKQVSCAPGEFTAAIKTDGTLWTWGSNYGTLGINEAGAATNRTTPVTTFAGGTNWKQVSCANNHTAAIKTDGTLWVWGNNVNGRIGTNDAITKCTPVTTFAGGTNWKQVACGVFHTSAIKTDGTLWGWGYNTVGGLGINNVTTPICTPVTTFAGGTNWKQVASGGSHTAAVTYIDDYQ